MKVSGTADSCNSARYKAASLAMLVGSIILWDLAVAKFLSALRIDNCYDCLFVEARNL